MAFWLRWKYVFLFWMIVLLSGLACTNGVNPQDPSLPKTVDPYIGVISAYVSSLKGLPRDYIPQPLILKPVAPVDSSGLITFEGIGPNRFDLQASEDPVINLYRVELNGCKEEIALKEKLGSAKIGQDATTDSNISRNWVIADVKLPANTYFVAAKISIGGKEGALSAPLILEPLKVMPVILQPGQAEQVGRNITITGKALSGLCLTIVHNDSPLPDVYIKPTKQGGMQLTDWSTTKITIQDGLNHFKVSVKGLKSINPILLDVELAVPHLEWPFGTQVDGTFQPDKNLSCVTTWYGPNNFYLTSPLTAFDRFHHGIDLDCKSKTVSDIHAVAEGVIFYVFDAEKYATAKKLYEEHKDKDDKNKYPFPSAGINIAIDHGAWISRYMHFENLAAGIVKGKEVNAGDLLGVMGTTGNSTGNHLHLEIYWWSDVSLKEKLQASGRPSGSVDINLNSPSLAACPGVTNLWDLTWTDDMVSSTDGTSFTICQKAGNCCKGKK